MLGTRSVSDIRVFQISEYLQRLHQLSIPNVKSEMQSASNSETFVHRIDTQKDLNWGPGDIAKLQNDCLQCTNYLV
jgi:hypothetical protein